MDYKKRYELQVKLNDDLKNLVEKLERQLFELNVKYSKYDVDVLKEKKQEMDSIVEELRKRKEEYNTIIDEVEEMKNIIDKMVFDKKWKLIRKLAKLERK